MDASAISASSPHLKDEAFEDLRRPGEFAKVINGGYFVEWACGADLSADAIEARWQAVKEVIAELALAQTDRRSPP